MKFTIAALALATSASAAATGYAQPVHFKFTATKTDSNGQLDKDLHANGGRLWVNKSTKTYCPNTNGIDCSNLNPKDTTFSASSDGSTQLNVVDPGGQTLFIGGSGVVRFTEGHDGAVPSQAHVKHVKSTLTSGARTWLCNESNTGKDTEQYYLVVAPTKTGKPIQAGAHNTCTRVKVVAKADQGAKSAFRFE